MITYDPAGVEIHDGANIDPVVAKLEAGNITDPNLIRCLGVEILLQYVDRFLMLGCIDAFGIGADAGQAEIQHDAGNIFLRNGMTALPQNCMNFVGTEDLLEFIKDVVNQDAIFFLPLFILNIVPLVSKVVIGTAGYIQGFAQRMDIVLAMKLFQRI